MTPRSPAGERRGRAPKVAIFVAQAIVNEITREGYPPGHRLPSEPQMLQEYAVARGTLREALRILETNGVVRVRSGPGGGPMVMQPNARHLASTLALLLQMHDAPIKAVIEARTAIEPMVAAIAAEQITTRQLEEVGESVDAMRVSIDDVEKFLVANFAFHKLIAAVSGNALFSDLVQAFDCILDGKFKLDYSVRARKAILRAHESIYAALSARDARAARQTMVMHLDEMQTYMRSHNTKVMDSVVRWDDVKDL